MFYPPTLTNIPSKWPGKADSNLEFSTFLRILHWKGVIWREPVPNSEQTSLTFQPPAHPELQGASRAGVGTPWLVSVGHGHTPSQTAAISIPLRSRGIRIRYVSIPRKNGPKEKIHAEPGNITGTMWKGNWDVRCQSANQRIWEACSLPCGSLTLWEYSWRRARTGFSKQGGLGQRPPLTPKRGDCILVELPLRRSQCLEMEIGSEVVNAASQSATTCWELRDNIRADSRIKLTLLEGEYSLLSR